MKRHQIRRMIPGTVSDAQVRRAIGDLGLPADDNHDYSDDEARQILNQFRGKPINNIDTPCDHDGTTRHAQTTQTAHTASIQDKASLAVHTQKQLASIQASLDKIAIDRDIAVEQVADTLAYLYSPQTFHADVLNRTAQRLGLKQAESDVEPDVITLDSLSDCFSDFANSVYYPAITPISVLGALPM